MTKNQVKACIALSYCHLSVDRVGDIFMLVMGGDEAVMRRCVYGHWNKILRDDLGVEYEN